jgi:hypothetical protein
MVNVNVPARDEAAADISAVIATMPSREERRVFIGFSCCSFA